MTDAVSPSPPSGEQRYLILEYKVRIFEDMIHQDNEFTHDGGKRDFGGFASGAKALVKLFELAIASGGDESRHVEGASYRSAAATDGAEPLPTAALTSKRSQSGQGGGLLAIEGSQFRQFRQDAQGGDGADAGNGFEFLEARMQGCHLPAQLFELVFDLGQIPFEPADQTLGLAAQAGQGELLGLLPLGDDNFHDLLATANQFGELLFERGAGRSGFGPQGLAIGGEHRRIDLIGFGALATGFGEVAGTGGIEYADGDAGGLECRHDVAFIATGGFANDLAARLGGQKLQESAMARDSIGQVVGTTRQMKLQVELGNIQAGIDSSHSVLAHSCKCELALVGRSINGSSLGHRHERLRLPTHLVNSQCQRATNWSAPLSCRLQAAGQSHLPHPIFPDKDRWKTRYKRAG